MNKSENLLILLFILLFIGLTIRSIVIYKIHKMFIIKNTNRINPNIKKDLEANTEVNTEVNGEVNTEVNTEVNA